MPLSTQIAALATRIAAEFNDVRAEVAAAGGGSGPSRVKLTADVVNASATANTTQDVTGLSFPVVAGNTYHFRFVIPYTSAATTTGSRWSINGPALTSLFYVTQWANTATTSVIAYLSSYANPNIGSGSALAGNVAFMEGVITPSASGTVIARFASEIANSAITAKAGAFVEYRIT